MTMTAKELYEIVKDVDRNAWPESSAYMTHTLTPFWVYLGKAEDSRIMELAFVGAMVAWLSKERCPNGGFTIVDMGDFQRVCEYHDGTGYEISDNYDRPTLIEALAAACKATKQEAK